MVSHFRRGRSPALLAIIGGLAFQVTAAAAPAEAKTGDAQAISTVAKPKSAAKKLARKRKKDASAAVTPAALKETSPHRRIGASPAFVVGDSDAHFINEAAPPLEQFPTDSKAVKKAFDETRRDQLADAEKAARDPKTADRWRSVLFALRGLPERVDPEACFWRVLAFYRLGELQRARTLRDGCALTAKESGTLNAEDAIVAGVPEMGTVPFDDGFGPLPGAAGKIPAPPPPTAPYGGPGPDHR